MFVGIRAWTCVCVCVAHEIEQIRLANLSEQKFKVTKRIYEQKCCQNSSEYKKFVPSEFNDRIK